MTTKRVSDLMSNPYSVSFSDEQRPIVHMLTIGQRRSFSELVEGAFAHYIPLAFRDEYGVPVEWPHAKRTTRISRRKKRSSVYGVLFNAEQDRVLRTLMRHHHVRFSELVERAFADYIPAQFAMPWPSTPRLRRTA